MEAIVLVQFVAAAALISSLIGGAAGEAVAQELRQGLSVAHD
jgi:hypothetical protein